MPTLKVMPKITEEEIISLIRTDAEKAFRLIIDNYGSRLYWHIRRMVIIHDDADDALQNTFISAWKNIAGFRYDSSLLTWLWSIATNEALTLIRKRDRHSTVSLDDLDGIFALVTGITREFGALYGLVNNAAVGLDGLLATQ
ncbi:MAG: sigma-70 family RNA polymerase sigma factor, partial [Bacteroidales bacterium]